MRIALAGNPNSGKTTMYNSLTGRNEKVGNWAGVTVDKKESPLRREYSNNVNITIVDLPGAYSMSPFTSEESITSTYINDEKLDAIINIVDATNLSRSLFFTTQLLELGVPVVVALNKSDLNEKKETVIDIDTLSKMLRCPVYETTSTSGVGLSEMMDAVIGLVGKGQTAPFMQTDIDFSSREAVNKADRERFKFVNCIVSNVETRKILTKDKGVSDKIDKILINRWLGIPIFAFVMFIVFDISQASLGPWVADILVSWIEKFMEVISEATANAHPVLRSILIEGMIGGVGAVVGFLPLVMIMYFLIALLEDCGYMARVSVVLDPIFKKVGLSGKSVIPFVIGTGCAIPGVMACRTIRNERERRATAMLTPFMPCGAKLPVIALFAGVFFKDASWVGTMMYFAGIFIIFLGALIVNKIAGAKIKSFFIMEIPEYKIPSLKRAFFSMCSRGWEYIVKAGTIILVSNTIVHIMQTFNWNFEIVDEAMAHTSILASISKPISYILIPLGFGMWQMAAASVTGFIAKENVVGTLAVCYGITNFIDAEEFSLLGGANEVAIALGITKAAALACLVFNLFTPPCFAAIGAMNSEIKDKKWMFGGVGLQLATGYITAFLIYQTGTLISEGKLGAGFIPGLVAVLMIAGIVSYLMFKSDKNAEGKKV